MPVARLCSAAIVKEENDNDQKLEDGRKKSRASIWKASLSIYRWLLTLVPEKTPSFSLTTQIF